MPNLGVIDAAGELVVAALLSTMARSAAPVLTSVSRIPRDSIKLEANTNTTRAMPVVVAIVVALRTNTLRTL